MTEWECTREVLQGGRVHRYAPRRSSLPISYHDVLRLWREDEGFRSFFSDLLAKSPFRCFRWETPSVSTESIDRPFEFVLLDAPGLDREPDPDAFAQHFRSARQYETVLAFPNLGNDAVLVVPRSAARPQTYVHLATFVREAPVTQVHELWRVVSAAMEARLNASPTWLSTAGMGVAWLHVRLDSRPKYYGFATYRETR